MLAKLFTAASLAVSAVSAIGISTPEASLSCTDTTFSFWEYTGSVFLAIVPYKDSCQSDALFEVGPLYEGSYTWNTTLAPGTRVFAIIDDDSGNEVWSKDFTIGEGNTACLTGFSSSSSASASATASSTASVPADDEEKDTRTLLDINNTPNTGVPENAADGPKNTKSADLDYPLLGSAGFSNAQVSLYSVLAVAGLAAFAL